MTWRSTMGSISITCHQNANHMHRARSCPSPCIPHPASYIPHRERVETSVPFPASSQSLAPLNQGQEIRPVSCNSTVAGDFPGDSRPFGDKLPQTSRSRDFAPPLLCWLSQGRDPKSITTVHSQPLPARTHSQTVIPVYLSSCKMPTCQNC